MAVAAAALVLSFVISYLTTPVVRQLAQRFDFVDRPDGQRKIQRAPVSLGGGLSLLLATPLAVMLVMRWWGPDLWNLTPLPLSLIGLAAGAAMLAVVGVIDDGFGMSGIYKLLWQFFAACLVMGSGFSIPQIHLFNLDIPLGMLGSLFTVAWLLGAINSLNLIDGVDGLAGSVGVVFSLTFGCLALIANQYLDAIIAFALAGALLGFLRFNLPPATIYLGDTGSMLIGLVLGTIALRCSMKQAATLAFAAPLAIWSIPMFDSVAALVRRTLTGRSIYATDRGHIHHVLLTRGLSPARAVGLIVFLCSLTSIGAIASIYLENEWLGIGVVACVISYLVLSKLFGHSEMLLLNTRLIGFGRHQLLRLGGRRDGDIRQTKLSLQGTRQWEELWGALVDSAGKFHVVKMRLNLSLPRLHEDFYATWQKAGNHRRELLWQTDIPLVVDGLPVGRLSVTGIQHEDSASREMSQFIDFVESLETQLAALIQQGLAAVHKPAGSTPPVTTSSGPSAGDSVDRADIPEQVG